MHYSHRLSQARLHQIVGWFVLVPILVFVGVLVLVAQSENLFEEKYYITTVFSEGYGLKPGKQVMLLGIQIGEVSKVEVTEQNDAKVTMEILKKYRDKIRQNSVAKIGKSGGLVGEPQIEITVGHKNMPAVADGGHIESEEPFNIVEVIAEVKPLMEAVKKTLVRVEEISEDVKATVQTGHEALNHVRDASTQLPAILQNVKETTAAVREATLSTTIQLPAIAASVRASVDRAAEGTSGPRGRTDRSRPEEPAPRRPGQGMIIARLSILLVALVAGGCLGGAVGPEPPLLIAQVQALRDKGHRALSRGDVARAGRFFDEARRLAESIDDRSGLAGALNDLGTTTGLQGDPGKAAEFHRQAHGIALELDDRALIAESLSYRGQAAHLLGDHAAALAFYFQALALAREVNDRLGEAIVLNNLGLLQQAKGEAEQAEQSFQRALALNTELGERRAMASNLSNLGTLSEKRGHWAEARSLYEQALALDKETEQRPAIEADLVNLGQLSEVEHRLEEAISFYDRAYRGYRVLNQVPKAVDVLTRLIRVLKATGQESVAATYQTELNTLTPRP